MISLLMSYIVMRSPFNQQLVDQLFLKGLIDCWIVWSYAHIGIQYVSPVYQQQQPWRRERQQQAASVEHVTIHHQNEPHLQSQQTNIPGHLPCFQEDANHHTYFLLYYFTFTLSYLKKALHQINTSYSKKSYTITRLQENIFYFLFHK